ncbi:MAG: hypothetical protein II725_05715 [Firmicutes bacterium]|nr:hypothetical protein [Bacillota bacterium]
MQELMHTRNGKYVDIENYFPLLMVKDFNARGFTVSDEFMTNADVPALAADGIIKDPVNPFTGRPINMNEKTAHDQFVILSRDWTVDSNNGNVFNASEWAAVTDDIWNRNDWLFIDYKTVLKDHSVPEQKGQ